MAGDSTAVAIYKLAMESQQYVAQAQAAININNQLAASAAPVAAGEEKIDKALRGGEAALDRKIARFDQATRINNKYAKEYADLVKIEEAGIGSAEKRAHALAVTTAAHEKELEALDRIKKANAENAAALGSESAALKASAAAGDRFAQALLDMQRKLAEQNKELQAGNIGLALHAKNVNLIQETYRNSTTSIATQEAAMRKSSTATGLARHELINLSRQFQDIGVSLAGGQSPFRILIEQGSQIADVFASSKAAFGDLWRSMLSGLARFGASAAGVAVGLMAIGAAGVAVALHWQEGQRVIEQALAGIGRRSGVTVAEINKIAESASETTRLSTAQAREIASGFVSTGEMFSASIKEATELTDKFALATGKSAVEGGKELAKILSEVGTGAETLGKMFGGLDDQTQRYLISLVRGNREEEARLLLIAKVKPIITDVANATSFWARAWMSVSGAASQAADSMGKALDKGIKFARDVLPAWRGPQFGAAAKQIGSGIQQLFADKGTMAADLGLGDLEKMKTATEQAAAAQKAYNAQLDEYSKQAGEALRSTIPQIEAIGKLKGALEDLERAQRDPNIKVADREQLQPAIDAVKQKIQLEEDSLAVQQRQVAAVRQVADAYKDAAGEGKKLTIETALQLNALDKQIAVYQQRTRRGVEAAVNEQKINELMLQGKSLAEAQLIITRQQTLTHLQNMTTLKEQLSVAEARTGIAKINAQYENDINQRLREGATLSQAIAEATVKRQIAIENVNTAITEQIHALQQENELIQARLDGDYASVKAAQAYANAIRQGADAAHAAALETAVLENELVKAAASAQSLEISFVKAGQAALASGKASATAGDLAAKLAAVGTGAGGNLGGGAVGFLSPLSGVYAGVGQNQFAAQILFQQEQKQIELQQKTVDAILAQQRAETPGTDEFKAAAEMQLQAAQAQLQAAQQQAEAAKAAREARISALDEAVKDIIATKLLAGQSAQAVNMLIEQGAIQFGTASTRFQTQLDLYKRAGASNSQIAADIRAGIIGEGARPSEILAALDSLTDAVNANTDAQLGLSPFYTSQGDRQLGYRGYTVQRGASNIPGTVGGVTGTPTAGGVIGGMGGVVNVGGAISYQQGPLGGSVEYRYVNGVAVGGRTNSSGVWTPLTGAEAAAANAALAAAGYNTGGSSGAYNSYGMPIGGRSYWTGMAEGGIVDRPTMGIMGEAGPEAFVPLKGGAIPVRLVGNAANNNKPANVVNINAPLVNFMADPTRDEVRQSAFQAAQLLRRVMAG